MILVQRYKFHVKKGKPFRHGGKGTDGIGYTFNEVYDGVVEVSLFSSEEGPCKIYFSYGRFYGIIYVDAEEAYSKREEVKKELAREYEVHKEPTAEFINAFGEKYKVCLPNDIFFDASPLFDF